MEKLSVGPGGTPEEKVEGRVSAEGVPPAEIERADVRVEAEEERGRLAQVAGRHVRVPRPRVAGLERDARVPAPAQGARQLANPIVSESADECRLRAGDRAHRGAAQVQESAEAEPAAVVARAFREEKAEEREPAVGHGKESLQPVGLHRRSRLAAVRDRLRVRADEITVAREVGVVEPVEGDAEARVLAAVLHRALGARADRGRGAITLVSDGEARDAGIAETAAEVRSRGIGRLRDAIGAVVAGAEDVVVGLDRLQHGLDEPGAPRAQRLVEAGGEAASAGGADLVTTLGAPVAIPGAGASLRDREAPVGVEVG